MIVVQQIRVRWDARARGASDANRRRGLPRAFPLPDLPEADVVVHDVLLRSATGYRPEAHVVTGAAATRSLGLRVGAVGTSVAVDRMSSPGAYPPDAGRHQLFTLAPGQLGRWRTNYRVAPGFDDPVWVYEDVTVSAAYARPRPDLFLTAHFAVDLDHRGRLYG